MPDQSKRSRSLVLLPVGLLLLATAAALVTLIPFYTCPQCEVDIAVKKGVSPLMAGPAVPVVHDCSHCNGYGRVTALTHWLKCSKHFEYFQFK
jgi:hypothetical protein